MILNLRCVTIFIYVIISTTVVKERVMKDIEKLQYEYDIINSYINQAISFLLKKQSNECMKALESLKLFSTSIFNMKFLLNDDDKN